MTASDPVARARHLAGVRESVLAGDSSGPAPRDVVSESWGRSLAACVDPEDSDPPVIYDYAEVTRFRPGHALAATLPLLRETLVAVADDATHMMIVTDAQGHILWREGQRDVLRASEDVGLVEGTRWTEDSIGTNAMGTALATARAVQIHSAEHLVRMFHPWTCAAAPVHDPDSGQIIGSVDVTGPLRTFHPATLALVVAAARLAENHLAADLGAPDQRLLARHLAHLATPRARPAALLSPGGRVLAAQPAGWLAGRLSLRAGDDRVTLGNLGEGVLEPLAGGWLLRLPEEGAGQLPTLDLSFLGMSRPAARLDGKVVAITPRHADLLAVLVLHPRGLSADELATALHGDAGKAVTVRAEVHRLRRALGAGVVHTQPYRLGARITADFLEVRSALAEGRVRDATRAHRGPLLPHSEAPAIRDERGWLLSALRRAVLSSGDVEAMWLFAQSPDGMVDDEIAQRLVHALPTRDPRHAMLLAGIAVAG